MPERRSISSHKPQLRSEGGKPKITGYSAVFYNANDPGTEYELARYGNYRVVERLMAGCFDRAVKEDDVRALFNHSADNVLGRSTSGTLRLSVDKTGLRYEIDPPDTQMARDLMEVLKRGDVSGSSFSFEYRSKSVVQQTGVDGSETDIIEVRETALYDVGPVTFPAYTSTTSGVRSDKARSAFAMTRRAERIEEDLLAFDKRLARNAPQLSRRSRREKMRERANQIAADAEYLGTVQTVEDARRLHLAGLSRRK